ncbi:MAG: tRNA pseudouridine(38-40) synthase TruA [Pseudomonadota bacterium]
MRFAIGIEYDGTAYNGWQRQRAGVGVQSVIEQALTKVADHGVELTCAGRTDTGVHAVGQVAHFDSASERSLRGWVLGANSNLPDDVNVLWAKPVPDSFHARFSALARTYRYLILNRLVRSALFRRRAWWVHQTLDEQRMRAAGESLLGEHDFSAFRAAGCQAATAVRELTALKVSRCDDWVAVTVRANAFLQHMVRNIVGTLVAVGNGDRPVGWVAQLLRGRDRAQGGVAAPAHGLTLVRVDYPSEFGIPTPDVDDPPPALSDA